MLSGRVIDATGVPVHLDARTVRRAWETLRAKFPEDFRLSRAALLGWHRREAETCLKGEHWWAAAHHMSQLLSAEPENAQHYQDRGRAFSRLAIFGRAVADYSRAIALKPGDWQAWWERGGAYAGQKRYERAVPDYSRAIALRPTEGQLWADRARAYQEMKQWAKARDDYTQALKINPKAWPLYQGRSVAYHSLDDKDRAAADLLQAIALGGPEETLCQAEWQCRIALRALEKIPPWRNDLLVRRGQLHARLGNWKQALADCTKAIEWPNWWDWGHVANNHRRKAWLTWARAGAMLRGDPQAADSLEGVLLPAEKFNLTAHREACLRLWAGDIEWYKKQCPRWLKQQMEDESDKGYLEVDSLHWVAERALRKVGREELEKRKKPPHKDIGWTCALRPDSVPQWDALIKRAEQGLKKGSQPYPAHAAYGAILYRAGKYREAIKHLHRAIQDRGELPVGESAFWSEGWNWLFLAMAHHKLGQAEEARKWLARADDCIADLERQKRRQREQTRANPSAANTISVAPWWESLELRLLRREVRAVLQTPPGRK
jgi:tetratricopeptide (TPR) repeat protein